MKLFWAVVKVHFVVNLTDILVVMRTLCVFCSKLPRKYKGKKEVIIEVVIFLV